MLIDKTLFNLNLEKQTKQHKYILLFISYVLFFTLVINSFYQNSYLFFVDCLLKFIYITKYFSEISFVDSKFSKTIKKIFLIKTLFTFLGYILNFFNIIIGFSNNFNMLYFDKSKYILFLLVNEGWIIVNILNFIINRNYLLNYNYDLNEINNNKIIKKWNFYMILFEIFQLLTIGIFLVLVYYESYNLDIIFGSILLLTTGLYNVYIIKYIYLFN